MPPASRPYRGRFLRGLLLPLFYQEPLRAAFLRYKFGGRRHYARVFGRWMADCLTSREERGFDFITWAPLEGCAAGGGGYDQAELLAREIAAQLSLPLEATLHKAHRPPLSGWRASDPSRSAQILGTYTLKRGAGVRGKRLLLVDDIITSGATPGRVRPGAEDRRGKAGGLRHPGPAAGIGRPSRPGAPEHSAGGSLHGVGELRCR